VRCANCGREVGADDKCSCWQQPEATILNSEEREKFRGITVESSPSPRLDDKNSGNNYYEYRSNNSNQRIHIRQMNFGVGQMKWTTKLMIAAIIAIIVFVFLPLAVLVAIGVSLIWMMVKFLRK